MQELKVWDEIQWLNGWSLKVVEDKIDESVWFHFFEADWRWRNIQWFFDVDKIFKDDDEFIVKFKDWTEDRYKLVVNEYDENELKNLWYDSYEEWIDD